MSIRERAINLYHDVNGLFTVGDLCVLAGFWLYRGTIRRTSAVAISLITMALVSQKLVDVSWFTFKEAFTGTALVFIASALGGYGLMQVGHMMTRRNMRLGESKGANLLEQMKIDRKFIHRDHLWKHVFAYESTDPQIVQQELDLIHQHRSQLKQLCDPEDYHAMATDQRLALEQLIRRIGLSETGWRWIFEFATEIPMARAVLRDRLRYDLSQLIDWYDGAPFHHTDTKLTEQYDGNEELVAAQKGIAASWRDTIMFRSRRSAQIMWFSVIVRSIQLRVAEACVKLDQQYAPFTFTADQFLWPSPELDAIILRQLGPRVPQQIAEMRRRIFKRVFNPQLHLSQRLLHRAIYPTFQAATWLRCHYDPAYMLGELHAGWQLDAWQYRRAYAKTDRTADRCRRQVQQATEQIQHYNRFINDHPELTLHMNFRQRRALRIAYFTNQFNLKQMILGQKNQRPSPTPDQPCNIADIATWVQRHASDYTRQLIAVRLHHELARLELEDYEFYLQRIVS